MTHVLDAETLKKQLIDIKRSIIENADDVIWMHNSNTTVCEQIDGMLLQLGCTEDQIEAQYEVL